MDRQIVYLGQNPLETDLLNTNRNVLTAIGLFAQDLLGAGTMLSGLGCTQTVTPSLAVLIAPGRIYSLQNLDNSAYSSLAADATHQIIKQGILLNAATLACPAPTTVGYSVSYLVEAGYSDVDTGAVALPYYNTSNPLQAYSGPNNSGTAQPTTRAGQIILQAKVGVAAATGSQAVPAPDAGFVGVWVVTVAYGQTTVTSANIAQLASAPFITALPALISSIQAAATTANYSGLTGTPPAAIANASVTISPAGTLGGGGGGTVTLAGLGYAAPTLAGLGYAAPTLSASGAMGGGGSGAVTLAGLGYSAPTLAGLGYSAPTINASGVMGGGGSGTVTLSGLGYTVPTLSGLGYSAPTLSAAGVLSGGGSGSVTLTGLGYTTPTLSGLGYSGATNATYGAVIGTNLSGQFSVSNISTFFAAGAVGAVQTAANAYTVPMNAAWPAGSASQDFTTATLTANVLVTGYAALDAGQVAATVIIQTGALNATTLFRAVGQLQEVGGSTAQLFDWTVGAQQDFKITPAFTGNIVVPFSGSWRISVAISNPNASGIIRVYAIAINGTGSKR